MGNALIHGGRALGEIEVGYQESPDHHIFFISDDGAGIDEENFQKLFGRFQRSPQAQGREGLGLGLAIVKEIAERHGGRAWIERRREKGVTFLISLAKIL